jgi:cell wall-associated NlpC family hydrolase
MASRLPLRALATAVVLVTLLGAPQLVSADGVTQAQRKVDQMLAELESLSDQLGQLDEDYSAALDRQAELQTEMAASQVKIDQLTAQLGGVQDVLAKIALDRYTSPDSLQLSPIFSNADTYSRAQQTAALGRVAIDQGQTDMDGLQKLVDDLADEQNSMQRKQTEATDLISTLTEKQAEYSTLEKVYTTKYAQAKADLGEAKLKAEEERRAAAASAKKAKAKKAAAAAAASKTTTAAPRGSGSGSSSGSGAVNYPSPSGKAGIAVSAAMGQLGVPYRYATAEPNVSFDCSGLTAWAWGRAGVSLPHQSGAQYNVLPHVPADQAQPGDLIFYYSPIGHVGLYLGNGQMVHAPQVGTTVSVTTVHWNKVVGVGRPG